MLSYDWLVFIHLATIIPAFFIGTFLLIASKGSWVHKILGRVYIALMMVTGVITLLMPARVGPRILGHFGFIHFFSFLTLYSAPAAVFAVRRGDLKGHRGHMIGLYVGGLLIAGSFAFAPGRLMHRLLFGA